MSETETPITVTYSLPELLGQINSKLDKMEQNFESKIDKIETKLDTLNNDINDLKVGQARLSEEVKGISKRLDSQEFINRSVVVGFILAIGTGAVKLFFPNFPK
ncbi:MAG: hypothetical protein AAGF26_11165 [Cyanobacteria bacterium P01_G01_bin.49]